MVEVTLKDWIEARWFKGAARTFTIIGGAALPVGIALVSALLVRIANVEASIATLTGKQAEMAATLERQDDGNTAFRSEVRLDINDVQGSIDVVQTDVATIKGMLEGMRSRDLRATALGGPSAVSP